MRAMLVFSMLFVVVAFAPANASRVELSYRVWFGGLELAEIDTGSEVVGGRYTMRSAAKSTGVLGLVYDFDIRSQAGGRIIDGVPMPTSFQSNSTFRDREHSLRMTREPGAVPTIEANPAPDPEDRDPVPEDLQRDSIDPLTAMLSASLRWNEDDVCTGTLPVYNGRTRTDVMFEPIGSEAIPDTDYSAYAGEARLCVVRWRVIAGGYKRDWAGLGKTFPDAKLWVARVGRNRHWVPVRLEADALIAPVIVHLVKLDEPEEKMSEAKR
jgi:hypothetical protein